MRIDQFLRPKILWNVCVGLGTCVNLPPLILRKFLGKKRVGLSYSRPFGKLIHPANVTADVTPYLLFYLRGLVKKFYLLPRNFLAVNGSGLNIAMDIHWTFTYTQVKLCIDTFTRFLSRYHLHQERYKGGGRTFWPTFVITIKSHVCLENST